MLHSRWISGALAFWEGHQCRIVDAFGSNVIKYINHFTDNVTSAADTPTGWTVTLVEGGGGETTLAASDAAGGVLVITTDAGDNDSANMQLKPEVYDFSSTHPAYFGLRFKLEDADDMDLVAGFCVVDTEIIDGGVTDGIYFRKEDGQTHIHGVLEKGSAETESTAWGTVADATWHIAEFFYDGTDVHFFFDGTESAAVATTNLPNTELLMPTIEVQTGSANAHYMHIDWIRCFQFND